MHIFPRDFLHWVLTAQLRFFGLPRAPAATRNMDQNPSSPPPDGLLSTVGAALVDPPTWWDKVDVIDSLWALILFDEPLALLFR